MAATVRNSIIPIIISKSYGPPTIGVPTVFIVKMFAIRDIGRAMKAIIVKVFVVSFCFVESKE